MPTILKGAARRSLIDSIAFERADFEIEYEGRNIEPFKREQVIRSIPSQYRVGGTGYNARQITIVVSDDFVRACQKRVNYAKRSLREFGSKS